MSDTTYNFSGNQFRGVFLGLRIRDLVIPAIGLFLMFALVFSGHLLSGVAIQCLAMASLVNIKGRRVSEWMAPVVSHFLKVNAGTSMTITKPRAQSSVDGTTVETIEGNHELVEGIHFDSISVRNIDVGVAWYKQGKFTLGTVVFEVSGPGQFGMLTSDDQHQLIAGWGRALQHSARNADSIRLISVTERALAGDPREYLHWVDDNLMVSDYEATLDYTALLANSTTTSMSHSVYVGVTIRANEPEISDALNVIGTQAFWFSQALGGADLNSTPCSLSHLRAHISGILRGSHPQMGLDTMPSLIDATDWSMLRVEDVLHKSYAISVWPRQLVNQTWLYPLINEPLPDVARNLTFLYRPMTERESRQAVNQAKIGARADEIQKSKFGILGSAQDRAKGDDADRRDDELAAGHGQHIVVGIITLSSTNVDAVNQAERTLFAAAGSSGLELSPCYGQQKEMLVATLPFGVAKVEK